MALPAAATGTPFSGRAASYVVSIAAAFVILGVAILPFFTPVWIHGEQDRSGAPAILGQPAAVAHADADSIVHDLVFGGSFDAATPAGQPILDAKEQAHMRDVRGVFQALAILVLAGLIVLALARRLPAAEWWRAVGRGAKWLAIYMAAIGVLSVVAFDAAFEVFHELLFPAGSFSFDPATEHLVQLFPDQFWSDTTLALGVLAFALSVVVASVSGRRAARIARAGTASAGAAALTPRSVG